MNNSAQYMIISTCFFLDPILYYCTKVWRQMSCLSLLTNLNLMGVCLNFTQGQFHWNVEELFMPLHFYLILQDLSALGHKIRYFFTVRQKRKFRIFVPWKPSLAISLVVLADKDGLELKILLYCNACNLLLMILRWSEFNKMKVGLGQVLLSKLRINGDIK